MHRLFAIEPQAINNWPDLRYALEKFGYSKGVLLARYPKTWMRLVMEACQKNNLGDVELKRIEEKLRQAQSDCSVRMGLPYKEESWLASAVQPEIIEKLDAVLVVDKANPPKIHCFAEVDETLFDNHRDIQVQRNAKVLAEAARYVLLSSDQLVLVDPYFSAKKKYIKVLNSMLDICSMENHKLKKIHIVTSEKGVAGDLNSEFSVLLKNEKCKGINFNISVLPKKSDESDFHARYLLGSNAGLRYDRGFVEPEDHTEREHLTDISCIDKRKFEDLWQQFVMNLEGDENIIRVELSL